MNHTDTTTSGSALASGRHPVNIGHLVMGLAFLGLVAQALELLRRVVRGGYHCPAALTRDPWLDALRGEAEFVRRMVRESADFRQQVGWFSSLVARSEHLPGLRRQLHQVGAAEVREVPMAQGSKQSRFIAWRF